MADPIGPVYAGNIEEFAVTEGGETYRILYLPDKNNAQLQREGKAPHYYWMPKAVRIARNPTTGDYKFRLLHFVGVRSGDTHVGVEGTQEVAGGVLSLTTTSEPPPGILEAAHEKLRQKYRGNGDRYWGWRTPAAPQFGVIPISSNRTTISNLSPHSTGTQPTIPAVSGGGNGGAVPAGGGGGAAPPSGGGNPDGGSAPPGTPRLVTIPRTLPASELRRERSNLDAWFVRMEGQGPASIDPAAENAFSALLGSLPTAILWEGFRGTYSPIAVTQAMALRVWSENIHLTIRGSWRRVFQHFSANVRGRKAWFKADLQAEFNKLMQTGDIEVNLMIDGTTPTADRMREAIEKRMDLILQKFMKQAEQTIFEPAPEIDPAQAESPSSGLFGLGGGLSTAFKLRRDVTEIELSYQESLSERYLLEHVISSTLEGFYDDIKADPQAEKKYFARLFLDDWERKVTRIVKPVVNWPDKARQWVGEPVAFLSCQIGYPNTSGEIQWTGTQFSAGAETSWKPSFTRKSASEVSNPPAGWSPDTTYVKRRVHLLEPPGESDFPYSRIFVEKNTIDLDPGENGVPLNDITLEVRADSVGKLEVGPIFLNVELENSKQFVEVSFQAEGRTHDGRERGITRFNWQYEDQDEPRYWEIFTGQLDYVPRYKYRVRVVIKGSIFSKGMEWMGPWVDVAGNGPLMVTVPTPEEATSTRTLTPREAALPALAPSPVGPPPPSEEILTPPPSDRFRALRSEGRTYASEGRLGPPPTEAQMREGAEEAEVSTGRRVPGADEGEEDVLAEGWSRSRLDE